MVVYHGTTYRSAQRIYSLGFLPKKPSRLVWFAASLRYATGARCIWATTRPQSS